jgi:hypothetical protein
MVKRFVLLTLFFNCLNNVTAQQSHDEQTIRAMLQRQNEAWNSGSIDSFMVGYWNSDSLLFIGKNGVTKGYQNTLTNYKKSYSDTAKMGKLQFTIVEVRKLSAKYYWVLGKWYLTRSVGDVGGYYTLLFRKIKGRWVIVADHSS